MGWDDNVLAWATALGLGLMIGVLRERRHAAAVTLAGVRTHALTALLGCLVWSLGPWVFVAAMAVVGALVALSYRHSLSEDLGLTGEITVLLTLALGALAQRDPPTAAALAVVCAVLLQAKRGLHRWSRELIREHEIHDALMLAAAALVIMPLLPSEPIDPWGALRPLTLWRIVVLVMAVGMLAHVALRLLGGRWGLPVAGFCAGFASSTAAVASFGHRASATGAIAALASAALLANLGSLLLLAAVMAAASPSLLHALIGPLALAAVGLLGVAAFGARTGLRQPAPDETAGSLSSQRAFKPSHALLIAAVMALVALVAAGLQQVWGEQGAWVAAVLVALVELQAAAASLAQLQAGGQIDLQAAQQGVVAVLAASALAKSVLAFVSGGQRYGSLVTAGLVAMVAGAAAGLYAPTA